MEVKITSIVKKSKRRIRACFLWLLSSCRNCWKSPVVQLLLDRRVKLGGNYAGK